MKIILKKQPKKYLESVPESIRAKLLKGLEQITKHEGDIVSLKGYRNRYRYKVAHYRIVFDRMDDGEIVIIVIEINTRTNIHY